MSVFQQMSIVVLTALLTISGNWFLNTSKLKRELEVWHTKNDITTSQIRDESRILQYNDRRKEISYLKAEFESYIDAQEMYNTLTFRRAITIHCLRNGIFDEDTTNTLIAEIKDSARTSDFDLKEQRGDLRRAMIVIEDSHDPETVKHLNEFSRWISEFNHDEDINDIVGSKFKYYHEKLKNKEFSDLNEMKFEMQKEFQDRLSEKELRLGAQDFFGKIIGSIPNPESG